MRKNTFKTYYNWNADNICTITKIVEENKNLPVLPPEIWLHVGKQIELLNEKESDTYYKNYFSPIDFKNQPGLKTRSGKEYGNDNTIKKLSEETLKIIEQFRKINIIQDSCEKSELINKNIKSFSKFIYKWYFWLYDHTFDSEINKLYITVRNKIYDFQEQLNSRKNEDSKCAFCEKNNYLCQNLINDCIYFIEVYHPYHINFRISNIDMKYITKYYPGTLNYEESRKNLNENIELITDKQIDEFEACIYDEIYYQSVLNKEGKKLRNGKYVISPKKKPQYFWKNNHMYRYYIF